MGHADISTTMNIYAMANPEVTRPALENLAKNMDIFQKRVLYLGDKIFDQKKFERPISDQKMMLKQQEMDRNRHTSKKEFK